jgi:hypothetical protein
LAGTGQAKTMASQNFCPAFSIPIQKSSVSSRDLVNPVELVTFVNLDQREIPVTKSANQIMLAPILLIVGVIPSFFKDWLISFY